MARTGVETLKTEVAGEVPLVLTETRRMRRTAAAGVEVLVGLLVVGQWVAVQSEMRKKPAALVVAMAGDRRRRLP